ncbi:hypothetical protein INR49_020765 [Caranx melampygus]|nr:hypothetical protein INR49_020765 [Caranx melampygus]
MVLAKQPASTTTAALRTHLQPGSEEPARFSRSERTAGVFPERRGEHRAAALDQREEEGSPPG